MKGTNIWPRIFCCLLAEEKTWTNHIQSLVLLSFCVKMWESIVALHQNCSYYDVVFQFKERHATFLERKITLSITQQLEKRFAVKSLGVNICGGKTCTNPLTPYILENCLRELLQLCKSRNAEREKWSSTIIYMAFQRIINCKIIFCSAACLQHVFHHFTT